MWSDEGVEGGDYWTIFSLIDMVMVATWEDLGVRACVCVCGCARVWVWVHDELHKSHNLNFRAFHWKRFFFFFFLIMEAGIITSGFGGINSHLCLRHNNTNTMEIAALLFSFPLLDERLKERRWSTFIRRHDFSTSVSPLFLRLSYPLSASPHPTQKSAFHCCLPCTCFLATELTCPYSQSHGSAAVTVDFYAE